MKIFGIICGLLISGSVMAQDYGLTVGFHQTTAAVDTSAANTWLQGTQGSINGKLNYDLGFSASFELVPNVRFRSGILYDTRNVDYAVTGVGTVNINFSYIDIPVDFQYNFTPMFGIYGGMIAGIKASDSVNYPSGVTNSLSPNMKSLYPLLNAGVNLLFNDEFGFDVYYESGLGS